ncbi:MAG: ATP-binding protein [Steroidobacteraceae bacterium]|nr:ATP-binding protein [Steroidobacteraceae bacterium]
MRYQDIFVPGGFPRHTYNPRTELRLEKRLGEVTENLCKLVTVTGQTKSGKTVLTRRVLPPESAIWIDGGTVSEEDDFWQTILEQLDIFQTTERNEERSSTTGGEVKVGATGSIFVAKVEGEAAVAHERGKASGSSGSRTVSARVAALGGLKESKRALVIDDFHYLPKDMQGSIVRALKPLIFDGLPAAIIAIPHRRYDALKVEKEMTGRISPIQIPMWEHDELVFISKTGFGLLNYALSDDVSSRLADEAIGSPHLMQDFCRGICRRLDLVATDVPSTLSLTERLIINAIFRVNG